jgi:hypothetical protein
VRRTLSAQAPALIIILGCIQIFDNSALGQETSVSKSQTLTPKRINELHRRIDWLSDPKVRIIKENGSYWIGVRTAGWLTDEARKYWFHAADQATQIATNSDNPNGELSDQVFEKILAPYRGTLIRLDKATKVRVVKRCPNNDVVIQITAGSKTGEACFTDSTDLFPFNPSEQFSSAEKAECMRYMTAKGAQQ